MDTKCYEIKAPAGCEELLDQIAERIRNGEVVAVPTETVYGLGANALNPDAVAKIYEAKGRPSDNPLIIHVCGAEWLDRYCDAVPDAAYRLADAFWPGPLTMILHRKPIVPDRTTGGLDTVGIRCPDHPVTLDLIRRSDVPIAAPSANTSGRPSCTTAQHVMEDVGGRIPVVIDGGSCMVGVESTIIDLTGEKPRLLRPGGLPLEEIERVIGPVEMDAAVVRQMEAGEQPKAPGMKYRHYAPKAPVTVVTGSPAHSAQYIWKHMGEKTGVICYDEFEMLFHTVEARPFGSLQNKKEQAQRVFDVLRSFDDTDVTEIYAQCPDPSGLGLAIGNRLKKAAGFHVIDADSECEPAGKFMTFGITGGTGAGKTTALRELSKLDVHIIDCDQVYHELLLGNDSMRAELKERFGDVFGPDGLDRKKLGNIVFRDPDALQDLNQITHKYVNVETDRQIEDARSAGMAGVAIDAILLLEAGIAESCDAVVGILAPKEVRVQRLLSRDGITEEYARARIDAQQPDSYYIERCDFILNNDSTEEKYANEARILFRSLLEEKQL